MKKIYQLRINGIATGFVTDSLSEILTAVKSVSNDGYENVDYLIITL